MTEDKDQLLNLLARLNSITRKQEDFAKEINELRDEIRKITIASKQAESHQPVNVPSSWTEIKADEDKELIAPAKPFQY